MSDAYETVNGLSANGPKIRNESEASPTSSEMPPALINPRWILMMFWSLMLGISAIWLSLFALWEFFFHASRASAMFFTALAIAAMVADTIITKKRKST